MSWILLLALPLLPVAGLTALALLHVRFVRHTFPARHCPACDYDRASTPDPEPCPECGLVRRDASIRLRPAPPLRRYWVLLLPPLLTLLLAILTIPIFIGIFVVPLAVALSTILVYLSLRKHLSTLEARWIQIPYWATFLTVLFGLAMFVAGSAYSGFSIMILATYFSWSAASAVLVITTPIVIFLAKRRGPDTQLLG